LGKALPRTVTLFKCKINFFFHTIFPGLLMP